MYVILPWLLFAGSFQFLGFLACLAQVQVVHDRSTYEYGRVCTHEDTYEQSHCESPDHLTSKDGDGEHHDEGGTGCVDGTGQGAVDGVIDILVELALGIQAAVLTDPVEDDHAVVDGVTDDGQHGGNEGLVYIQGKRQDTGEQGEEADCHDGVVGCGDYSSETPCPALEADGDVGEDREQGDGYGYQGVALRR